MARKILIIDDEAHVRRLIEAVLGRAGYEVITAINGDDGLAKLGSKKPELVILDVAMPEMDGFEVLERIQDNPQTRKTPVIMLTGKDQTAARARQANVTAYISKPFDNIKLTAIIAQIFLEPCQ